MEFKDLQVIKEKQNHGLTMTEAVSNLQRREIRIPFLLNFTHNLCAQWSGPMVIYYYAVEIFDNLSLPVLLWCRGQSPGSRVYRRVDATRVQSAGWTQPQLVSDFHFHHHQDVPHHAGALWPSLDLLDVWKCCSHI